MIDRRRGPRSLRNVEDTHANELCRELPGVGLHILSEVRIRAKEVDFRRRHDEAPKLLRLAGGSFSPAGRALKSSGGCPPHDPGVQPRGGAVAHPDMARPRRSVGATGRCCCPFQLTGKDAICAPAQTTSPRVRRSCPDVRRAQLVGTGMKEPQRGGGRQCGRGALAPRRPLSYSNSSSGSRDGSAYRASSSSMTERPGGIRREGIAMFSSINATLGVIDLGPRVSKPSDDPPDAGFGCGSRDCLHSER